MMRTVIAYAQSYNYDDSDSMTDYFDTNFYLSVYVGKWDKPFKIVQRTARLADKTPETAKARTEGDDKEYYTYDIKKDTDLSTDFCSGHIRPSFHRRYHETKQR